MHLFWIEKALEIIKKMYVVIIAECALYFCSSLFTALLPGVARCGYCLHCHLCIVLRAALCAARSVEHFCLSASSTPGRLSGFNDRKHINTKTDLDIGIKTHAQTLANLQTQTASAYKSRIQDQKNLACERRRGDHPFPDFFAPPWI